MSLEKKFHKMIEEENCAEKELKWQQLKNDLALSDEYEVNNSDNSKALVKGKMSAALGAIAIILILAILTTVYLLRRNLQSQHRYCSSEDYTISETKMTLKEYSTSIDKSLLFFEWYDETDFLKDNITTLNDTGEIICFDETMLDMNTGYTVSIKVTDTRTDIDFLDTFKTICDQSGTEKGIAIEWGGGAFSSYGMFTYDGYHYYLEIQDADGSETVLEYIAALLSV